MLITTHETLAADPRSVYADADCLRFLEVDPGASPRPDFIAHDVGRRGSPDPRLVEAVGERFADSNRRLAALTGVDYGAAGEL